MFPTAFWIADSGTTSHVVKDRALFGSYTPTPGAVIKGAGEIAALGRGDVNIVLDVHGKSMPITLRDCVHAPQITHNLVSLTRVTDTGFKVLLEGNGLKFIDPSGTVAGFAEKSGRLYHMRMKEAPVPVDAAFPSQSGTKTSRSMAPSAWSHPCRCHQADGIEESG